MVVTISTHAAQRYVERYATHMTVEQASVTIAEALYVAPHVGMGLRLIGVSGERILLCAERVRGGTPTITTVFSAQRPSSWSLIRGREGRRGWLFAANVNEAIEAAYHPHATNRLRYWTVLTYWSTQEHETRSDCADALGL